MREAPYSFTAEVGINTDRFLLRYNNETLSVENQQNILETYVYVKSGKFNVRSQGQIENISIYDLTGKIIVTFKVGDRNEFTEDFNFARGVYLAVIELENGTLVKKKLSN